MSAYVNVNGVITDAAHAVIPVYDHGFLYGEGVYEVFRTYRGVPFLFDRHQARLRASAARIALEVPFSDEEVLQRSLATMAAAGLGPASAQGSGAASEAYVRILLTRGVGEITYDPAACPVPSLVIIAKPLPQAPAAHYEQGIKVVMVEDIIRNHPESVSPLIKSNNLINNALGMQQAIRAGAQEAIFRNYRGELAECAQSNLFIVSKGVVKTPPVDAGLLAGITRAFTMEVGMAAGIRCEEAVLMDQDLFGADEAFFTSTTKEIVPIVLVDDKKIGDGRVGPVTKRLLEEYRREAYGRP
ncbi:MAG: aminotransferase class IV [Acidobacteriota bacterium]|nr:aminotransferase class IV [Acidobacteriota bacterium]